MELVIPNNHTHTLKLHENPCAFNYATFTEIYVYRVYTHHLHLSLINHDFCILRSILLSA